MSLQVIGIGFGRTGTLSLKQALETLGFGPCYHMTELLKDPQRVSYWEQLHKQASMNLDMALAGYRAAVDFPVCQHWRYFWQRNQGAKFILTVRDPDDWYDSMQKTIYRASSSLSLKLKFFVKICLNKQYRQLLRVFRLIDQSIWHDQFRGRFSDKEFAKQIFVEHIEQVKATIPPQNLLVYDIASGWEPLCRFLSIDVPNSTDFPNVNKRDDFPTLINQYI